MKIGIITDEISFDLKEALPIIKEEGYEYVELHSYNHKSIEGCTDEEVQEIKQLLKQYDMKVSNLASTIFFLAPLYKEDIVTLFNDHFYSIKGDVNVHLSHVGRVCKIAKELECETIRIFPFRFPDNREPLFGTEEHMERICEYFIQAADIAKEYDRTLVIENCPYSHCPKGEMTLKLLKKCNHPNLKLLWDPANSYRAVKKNVPEEYQTKSLVEELELIFPYIRHIHIKDYHYDENVQPKPFIHKVIYEGDIDYDSIFNYLKENGYQGVLSLEPEVSYEDEIRSMKILKEKIAR